jgi:2-dehydropantoate 2-reductase
MPMEDRMQPEDRPGNGPRIAVLGSGANGSTVGADLIRAGYAVTLVDQWPAHVEAMRAQGLKLTIRNLEEVNVPVDVHHICDLAGLGREFDVVLMAFKAYDARWGAELIKPYLAKNGLLVGLQNAMTADIIAEVVGADRTIGCVVELATELFTPGEVLRKTPPAKTWFGVGALDPSMEHRVGEVEALLKHAGKVTRTTNIRSAKYMKLVTNAMSLGTFAMVGLPWIDAMELPGMRELVMRIGDEAITTGFDLGFKIEPVFGLTEADLASTNRPAEKLFEKLGEAVGPSRGKNTALQDHLKGRLSEVEMINGLIVEASIKRGREAPANAAVVAVTKRIHAGELKPGPANMAIVNAMLAWK